MNCSEIFLRDAHFPKLKGCNFLATHPVAKALWGNRHLDAAAVADAAAAAA